MPPTHLHGYQTFKTGEKIVYSCTRCGWERVLDISKILEEDKELLERLASS